MLLIFIVLFWLKGYTNHGQQLELPDYVGVNYEKAKEDAEDRTFDLIINDSIHIVGKPGGEILDQNPVAYSKVKENRKIYVTTAKYNADMLSLENLPALYGKQYEGKKRELSYLDINADVKGYVYDPGEPDHILEVWHEGRKIISSSGNAKNVNIEKGGSLQFVLSKRGGGQMEIPDLKCKQVSVAEFILTQSSLTVGTVNQNGEITDLEKAYIISQYPSYAVGKTISMGEAIDITISQTRPGYCR